MGLPEIIEPRLMRAMIEAVKQHRLRRERAEVEQGDWADSGPEPIGLRLQAKSDYSLLRASESLVNVGGDGNDFAIFIASFLQALGARVRVAIGCTSNFSSAKSAIPIQAASSLPLTMTASVMELEHRHCQRFAEVRLGRNPAKVRSWVRSWLPGNRWLGKSYYYRQDLEGTPASRLSRRVCPPDFDSPCYLVAGYVWLNLDWIDGDSIPRPGVPYKPFEFVVTYYPSALIWEVDGEEADSSGNPKARNPVVDAIQMGIR